MACSGCGIKRIAKAYVALLLNKNSELALSRLAVCTGCEKNNSNFCMICKCWVVAKVRGADQVCPLNKW